MKITNPFKYTEKQLYELMHEQGKKRFGIECKHEKVSGGYCLICLRKVVTRRRRKSNGEAINNKYFFHITRSKGNCK